MKYQTSLELYLPVTKVWNILGISPIHVLSVVKNYSSSAPGGHQDIANAILLLNGNTKPHKDKKVRYSQNSRKSLDILNTITTSGNGADADSVGGDDGVGFSIYVLGSYKTTSSMFWFMLVFFYVNLTFSAIRMVYIFKESSTSTTFLVASLIWVIYSLTGAVAYIVHFCKTDAISKLLTQWQIIEGELLLESNAIKCHPPSYYEYYMKSQMNGLMLFLVLMPLSYIFMGISSTFSIEYPMNIYSIIPDDWRESHSWIHPVCKIYTWIQVGLCLLAESQVELIVHAFVRSVCKCLQTLTSPTDLSLSTRDELLNVFHDSVNRYQKLNKLLDLFNMIFRWPILIRQGLTMAKICCYTYLLLRHSRDNGFPGMIVFPYGLFAIFYKFGVILSRMGKVRMESERFILSWERRLLEAFPQGGKIEEERKLKCCKPFGFFVGNFYMVYPYTVLTFCSVIMTFVLLLLQTYPN